MGRFFVQADAIVGNTVTITNSDANHIARVLRMSEGDCITVCDMQRREYTCILQSVSAQCVVATVQSCKQNDTESPVVTTLYQALPKGDKMETLIQKAVECGVCCIVPFSSERCVVKLDAQSAKRKQERWQKIAQSAAEQSGRGIVPVVQLPISFAQAVEQAKAQQCAFLCYEGEQSLQLGTILPQKPPHSIGFLIGPEGGFSQNEVAQAQQAGIESVGLGKRILRTETASTFVLSAITFRYELGDMM